MVRTEAVPASADLSYPLSEREFRSIVAILHRETGISLGPSKREMVQGRLGRRLRALRCPDFPAYLARVDASDGSAERRAMINALTTNLTGFFREKHHFDALGSEILPQLAQSRAGARRRLRIWSAGCSSGEEPYSIAMVLLAALPAIASWDARILATDLDTEMIATCRAGRYDAARTEAVPAGLRARYMRRSEHAGTGKPMVEIAEEPRRLITFKPLNLMDAWPMQGPFDVIFCRNVIIYFDKPTQRTLFDRFADILAPDGWLLIGHSESLFHVSDRFTHLGRTIYRKTR